MSHKGQIISSQLRINHESKGISNESAEMARHEGEVISSQRSNRKSRDNKQMMQSKNSRDS